MRCIHISTSSTVAHDMHESLCTRLCKIMQDLYAILEPFEVATNASQGQNVVTSIEVIIIVPTLKKQLDNLSNDYSCKLLSTLLQSVNTRLSK